uniref:MHC class I-like antigen recognition-like domain-containing protein n=1 Tax=Aquila chrysaetos chrysaetos TaxID=223781 RepID=A0A663FK54_AQUCH
MGPGRGLGLGLGPGLGPGLGLGLLLGVLVGAASGFHSLRYFFVAVSEPSPGVPQFMEVGYVDGNLIVRYDSETGRMVPRADWMADNLDQQYWDIETQKGRSHQQISHIGLNTLWDRYNQSKGECGALWGWGSMGQQSSFPLLLQDPAVPRAAAPCCAGPSLPGVTVRGLPATLSPSPRGSRLPCPSPTVLGIPWPGSRGGFWPPQPSASPHHTHSAQDPSPGVAATSQPLTIPTAVETPRTRGAPTASVPGPCPPHGAETPHPRTRRASPTPSHLLIIPSPSIWDPAQPRAVPGCRGAGCQPRHVLGAGGLCHGFT